MPEGRNEREPSDRPVTGPAEASIARIVPPPGEISGASKLPPAPAAAMEVIAAAVGRLRGEVAAALDKTRKARLLHESGEIQERGGDEAGAARDYLAAYNADTSFREPLEGLVRLLERRRSLANLGKLTDALVSTAATPEERARALTQRAIFSEDVQEDLEGARGSAKEATETGAAPADLGPAWLTLELAAAKLGDAGEREAALMGRAELAVDPTWRGLLLVDVARLAAASGETDRALSILDRAREGAGQTTWAAACAVERIALADPGLRGSDEHRLRARALAESYESRAELIRDAMADASLGDDAGVPTPIRTPAHAVHLLLRAAEARRASSELGKAAQLLDRAIHIAGERGGSNDGEKADALSALLVDARLRIAELVGDTALAAELARKRLESEPDGGVAAGLAMRVSEHAASEGDIQVALEALGTALAKDPLSAPARALELDILEAGPDPERFASELSDFAKQCSGAEAKGRALLLAAFVWATRAKNSSAAKEALRQAETSGFPKPLLARVGRTLASVSSDDAWYEAATRELIEEKPPELSMLWVEIARLRLAQGDEDGAAKAVSELRALPEGAWLGRVLDSFSYGKSDEDGRARTALEELAAKMTDPAMRRSLSLVGAMRAHAAGDDPKTIEHLSALAAEDARDPLVAAYLGDLLRSVGKRGASADIAAAAAEALLDDPEIAAARHLEAGLVRWGGGDRRAAMLSFEAAADLAPEAAEPMLAWAARGVDVDAYDGRRRALSSAGDDAAVFLERFALEASLGDAEEARQALTAVDLGTNEHLRVAGVLGRLAWPGGAEDAPAVAGALDVLTEVGDQAREAAAIERLRLARQGMSVTTSDDVAAAAKAWLDVGGGTAAALEWLAATMATADAAKEVPARHALAELLVDEAREAMHASATLLDNVLRPDETYPLVSGSSLATRLANLELGPPGCDPRRRAAVLSGLDAALGADTALDALGMAAWSTLAAGEAESALAMFRTVTQARSEDLHAWEGMRAAAEELRDRESYAIACEQLGARCTDAARGAAFWEQAALGWLSLGAAFEPRADAALEASFERDASREVAFDKLFRRVRDKKEPDKLLAIVTRRLEVARSGDEIAKLYWEMARAFRAKGDSDAALEALAHVVEYDENHVGALALTGEIFIRRGLFAEAADKLAKLATVSGAPPKNRVTAGITAVDLFENKLQRHDRALAVLLSLHEAQLSTTAVRERLARAAARTGEWGHATRVLEELMVERPERDGRIEAARLAMVIHRDRLRMPTHALRAVTKLLEESPCDAEALDLVMSWDPAMPERRGILERGREALLRRLDETPSALDGYRLLSRMSLALGDGPLEHSALAAAVALGGFDGMTEQRLSAIAHGKPRMPAAPWTDATLRQTLAAGDEGPVADLFMTLGPTIAEALGPHLATLGVTKRDRVEARAALPVRAEIAAWAAAFGIPTFDLYVGGRDPMGVQGIPGATPALVIGAQVVAPLSPASRARLARELLGIVRGTTVIRWRDDATIAAIAVAACNLVKVRVDFPPASVLAEVERLLDKALSRKVKPIIQPICNAFVQSGQDPRQWAARARASQSRAGAVASGDVGVVLADVFGEPPGRLGVVARDDLRAHELLRFVVSRPYFDLRRALGLEG